MKRIDIIKRAARPALLAVLLSTTALAAVPDDAGVLLSVTPRGVAPPVVERLAGDTLAGRSFTAADGRVLELLLSDGTTLRLAPGSRLTIEDYSFDEASRAGALAVRVEAGTVRITGGRLNTTSPVRVLTPAGIGELRDGAGVIEVDAEGMTTTNLLFGESFSFTANGEIAQVYRPGFEVSAKAEEDLDGPRRDEAGGAEQVAFALNPALAPAPEGEVAEIEPGAGPTGLTPTQTFPTLVALEETRAEAEEEGATENAVGAARQSFEDALDSGAGAAAAGAGDIGGSLDATFGFGPSLATAANLTGDQPSISASPAVLLRQDFSFDEDLNLLFLDEAGDETTDPTAPDGTSRSLKQREIGLTSNVLFGSSEAFIQSLSRFLPRAAHDQTDEPLTYGFNNTFGDDDPEFFSLGSPVSADQNPFMLDNFLVADEVFVDNVSVVGLDATDNGEAELAIDPRIAVGNTVFGIDGTEQSQRAPTLVRMLQTGFINVDLPEFAALGGVARERENFIVLQVQPALGSSEGRKLLVQEYERRQADLGEEDAAIFLVSAFGIGIEAVTDPDRGINFEFVLPASEAIPLAANLADVLSAEDASTTVNALVDAGKLTDEQRARVLSQISRNERFIFAAGDVADPQGDEVEGSLAGERRVERFFLSPGLEGYEEQDAKRVASLVRAFLRNATAFREEDGSDGLKLADTGLIVVGTPANSVQKVLGEDGDEQIAAIHVDFGIEGLGEQSKLQQRSTISATIGEVAYGVDGGIPWFDNDDDADNEVVLRGRTIGSTRGPTKDDPEGERGSVLAVGDVFNTAAGGGGKLDVDGQPQQPLPGRATYLVIENFDPVRPQSTGGEELPVGGAAADRERFAILRLATATQSVKLAVDPDQETQFRGFAAALGEVVSGERLNVVPLVSGADENGLVLDFGPQDNRVRARLRLIDANTGETRELTLGGLTGTDGKGASAFIDPNRFGARTRAGQDAEVAMVSGELVKDGLANLGDGEGADTKAFLARLSEVDVPDLKWGFFFGDVDGGQSGEGARTHVHLGSWVAGRIADPSRLPRNGTATYSGHAVGNVTSSGNSYTQIGKYQSTWNFGSRAGLTDLNFDGARMRGFTQAAEGSVRFGGGLSGDGRNASIAGAFVRGKGTGIAAPAGQIGAFTVSGNNYGAAGTFAAKKQ